MPVLQKKIAKCGISFLQHSMNRWICAYTITISPKTLAEMLNGCISSRTFPCLPLTICKVAAYLPLMCWCC